MSLFMNWLTGLNPVATNFGLLILRVMLGIGIVTHGYSKVFGEGGPAKMAGFLEGMGIPAPLFFAWCAALAEFAGGIFILLGLLTRPAALMTVITMLVAIFVAHADDPFQKKEMAYTYLAGFLTLLFTGSGSFAIDRIFWKKK